VRGIPFLTSGAGSALMMIATADRQAARGRMSTTFRIASLASILPGIARDETEPMSVQL
jgi:hypothetical protein